MCWDKLAISISGNFSNLDSDTSRNIFWDDSLPTAARLESLIISVRYWFGLAIFFFLLTFDFVLYSLDPFPVAWKVSSFKPLQQHDFFCATQQPEECIPTFMRKLRALERLDPQRLER